MSSRRAPTQVASPENTSEIPCPTDPNQGRRVPVNQSATAPAATDHEIGDVIIEMRKVDKFYGDFHVLRDIDLTVSRGERGKRWPRSLPVASVPASALHHHSRP